MFPGRIFQGKRKMSSQISCSCDVEYDADNYSANGPPLEVQTRCLTLWDGWNPVESRGHSRLQRVVERAAYTHSFSMLPGVDASGALASRRFWTWDAKDMTVYSRLYFIVIGYEGIFQKIICLDICRDMKKGNQ
jgi:hypothetical protein